MAKHTAGPWRVVTDAAGDSPNVVTEDGTVAIAHCGGMFTPTASYPDWQVGVANARLMAASPSMVQYIQRKASEGDAEAKELYHYATGQTIQDGAH